MKEEYLAVVALLKICILSPTVSLVYPAAKVKGSRI